MVAQLNHAVLRQRWHINGMKLLDNILSKYLVIGVSIGLPSRLFIILKTSHVLKDTQFPFVVFGTLTKYVHKKCATVFYTYFSFFLSDDLPSVLG